MQEIEDEAGQFIGHKNNIKKPQDVNKSPTQIFYEETGRFPGEPFEGTVSTNESIWEKFEKKEVEITESKKEYYFNIIKTYPIYPEVKIITKGNNLGEEVLISSLLRQRLEDGKYYISEIHQMYQLGQSTEPLITQRDRAINAFHKFVYMNITARTAAITELDILDIAFQGTEAERLNKIFGFNGK